MATVSFGCAWQIPKHNVMLSSINNLFITYVIWNKCLKIIFINSVVVDSIVVQRLWHH